MAILKKKLREVELSFRLPSDLSDIECRDGEVALFENVPWLENAPPAGTVGGGSSSSAETLLSLETSSGNVTLPYGSRLLAIHSPAYLRGERRYLVLLSSDMLAVQGSGRSLEYLPGVVSRLVGEVRDAVTWGDLILVIGSAGMAWVVFSSSDAGYHLLLSPPAPPDVSFSLTPAHMPGYTMSAGSWPAIDVAVSMKGEYGATRESLQSWLSGESVRGVSAEARDAVFAAVGMAFEAYMAKARAEGFLLTPLRAVASLDASLPTNPMVVDSGYQPPCALLDSWSFADNTLYMRLSLSLLPRRLSATFRIPESQRFWAERFGEVRFSAGRESEWRTDPSLPLTADALTTYTDPSTGDRSGMAFRFPALSREALMERVAWADEFRTVGRVLIKGVTEEDPGGASAGMESEQRGIASGGTIMLRPQTGKDPLFNPDYRDLTAPRPAGAIATDRGFILWGGDCTRYDREGNKTSIPLRNCIVAADPANGFLWRHVIRTGEGEIRGVAQGSGARSAAVGGRHPLHVISTDGIRLMAADGEGGYICSRLLSRDGALPDTPVAFDAESVLFESHAGIISLGMNSAVKVLEAHIPDSPWPEMYAVRNLDALLLRAPGRTALMDLRNLKYYPLQDVSLRPLVEHEGILYTLKPSGELISVSVSRVYAALRHNVSVSDSISGKSIDSDGSPRSEVPAISEDSAISEGSVISEERANWPIIRTRPIKLGSPFSRKRIVALTPLSDDVRTAIYGSDNLPDWHPVADSAGGIKALHTRSFRYFSLMVSASDPELLRSVRIAYKQL